METRFDTTQHGDPQLTITLDGAHDLFRFAVNMLNDQCEFSRAGRKALATLRSHLGPAQFDPWAAGVLGDQRYERLRDLGMFEYDEGI